MTTEASTEPRDEGKGNDNRVQWWSGASLRLHGTLLLGVAICSVGAWIEWTRALSGHTVAWGYSFEWPIFAVMGTYMWWKLLHADLPTTPRNPTQRSERSTFRRRQVQPAGEDVGLVAWQEYLARLHAADPPGGPPADPVRGQVHD
ncbi:MAG: hypothetical protein ABI206_03505 [Antricoccus sp.]